MRGSRSRSESRSKPGAARQWNPDGFPAAPFRYPQFTATTTWGQRIGDHLLDCSLTGIDGYPQPYATGRTMTRDHAHVAWLDALATAKADATVIFLVNRRRDEAKEVTIDPGARHAGTITVSRSDLACLPEDERPHRYDAVRETERDARTETGPFNVTIPAAGVAIVELS